MMLAVPGSACGAEVSHPASSAATSDRAATSGSDSGASPTFGSPSCLEDFVKFFPGEMALMSVVEDDVPQALAEHVDVGPVAVCTGWSSVTGQQIWAVVPSSGSPMHFTGDQSSGLQPIDTSDAP
jgi:hypothetical protein